MKLASNCQHTDRPLKAKGLCGSCYNKSITYGNAEKRQAHLLSRNKYSKQRREKTDPKLWASKQRNRILKYRYGINQAEYTALLTAQDNRCAICLNEWEAKHPLYVDHNHTTGQTRGLLCAKCNTQVGMVETGDITKVMEYIAYYDH